MCVCVCIREERERERDGERKLASEGILKVIREGFIAYTGPFVFQFPLCGWTGNGNLDRFQIDDGESLQLTVTCKYVFHSLFFYNSLCSVLSAVTLSYGLKKE